MNEGVLMFNNANPRFASLEVVSKLPDEAIDNIWFLIDKNLQGVFDLSNLIVFNLINNDGRLSYDLIQSDQLVATFDSPYPYQYSYPNTVLIYDNGERQLIATPAEINN